MQLVDTHGYYKISDWVSDYKLLKDGFVLLN